MADASVTHRPTQPRFLGDPSSGSQRAPERPDVVTRVADAGEPDVPFCAADGRATVVVLGVVRRPSGYGWWYPQHRMPSASPHAVRTALVASRACFCCCAAIESSGSVITDESRLRRPQPPGMNVQPVGQLPFGQPTCHQGPSR
jgi:hypothetical protein